MAIRKETDIYSLLVILASWYFVRFTISFEFLVLFDWQPILFYWGKLINENFP